MWHFRVCKPVDPERKGGLCPVGQSVTRFKEALILASLVMPASTQGSNVGQGRVEHPSNRAGRRLSRGVAARKLVHGVKRRASSFNTGRVDHLYVDPHEHATHFFLHHGDLIDATNLIRLVQESQPDEIYNLAVQSHVQVSFETAEYTASAARSAHNLADTCVHLLQVYSDQTPITVGRGIDLTVAELAEKRRAVVGIESCASTQSAPTARGESSWTFRASSSLGWQPAHLAGSRPGPDVSLVSSTHVARGTRLQGRTRTNRSNETIRHRVNGETGDERERSLRRSFDDQAREKNRCDDC
jgi:hypothetical protein